MSETKKEKSIRFMLIGFFILVTMFAFFLRNDNSSKQSKTHQPSAIVMNQSQGQTIDPIVALYEYKNGNHVFALYKIERNNQYKFKTLHAIKLHNAPDKLLPDKHENGIWLHIENKWHYFSERLEMKDREIQFIEPNSPYEASFEFNKETMKVLINNNHTISLSKGSNPPIGIYSLSKDETLWLIITKDNIKIGKVATK